MTLDGLYGGTLKPVSRYGDVQNKISIGTAGAFLAKDRFKESNPYTLAYTTEDVLYVHINLHFIAEARRQLSGNEEAGTSTFSPSELLFWNEFVEYQDDIVKTGETLMAVEAFDQWLIEELTGDLHTPLNRDYEEDHKWYKVLDKPVDPKGIQWI